MFLVTKEYISAITAVTKNIIVHGGIEDTTKNRSVVMKLLAVFAFSLMLIYASAGILPAVYDGPTYELVTIDEPDGYGDEESDEAPIRSPRVTCDLLSWQSKWLTINHSACAAKCLVQRRRGGRCRDGVCICRK